MRSTASSVHGTNSRLRNNKGSTLVAVLALVFLIFSVTAVCLERVAASYTRVVMRHNQASSLFIAEAGIQKAGEQLLTDSDYTGEKNKITTGHYDVSISRKDGSYIVTSTGYADSPFQRKSKITVQAEIRVIGGAFRIVKWRENP